MVFIYGSRTHIDSTVAQQILQQRGSKTTSIKVWILKSIVFSFAFIILILKLISIHLDNS